jgi:hypothetical protein
LPGAMPPGWWREWEMENRTKTMDLALAAAEWEHRTEDAKAEVSPPYRPMSANRIGLVAG